MEILKTGRIALFLFCSFSTLARANEGPAYLREAARLYHIGQYFPAARYAFAAHEADPALKSSSYAWITMSLVHAGMPNAASYFFIRALQSGNRASIRAVLSQTQELFMTVGPDLIRQYMVRHTQEEDYDDRNRGAYHYVVGKDALLKGNSALAIQHLGRINSSSAFYAYAKQLRATAFAIGGRPADALEEFKRCEDQYRHGLGFFSSHNRSYLALASRESDDLRARCQAGQARVLYEMGAFEKADRTYDHISKQSIIWTDILSEQAWNAFARREYNRSLGKLVSYKSPALEFVFNPEIDVLTAQSYLGLCLYKDANAVVNEFNRSYQNVGEDIKTFVEGNSDNLDAFFQKGKSALGAPLHTKNNFLRVLNRFVRGPYFQSLVATESQIARERATLSHLNLAVSYNIHTGLSGFIEHVLQWRFHTVRFLGGAFVKNSLIDYHSTLLDDFDKMAFIKLEMLKRAKDQLINEDPKEKVNAETAEAIEARRARGNVVPERRDDQMRFGFNGEFWLDEMGDLVFGLESACK